METKTRLFFTTFITVTIGIGLSQYSEKPFQHEHAKSYPGNCSYWSCAWELDGWTQNSGCIENTHNCTYWISLNKTKGVIQSHLSHPTHDEEHCLKIYYFMFRNPTLNLSIWIHTSDNGDRELWNSTSGNSTWTEILLPIKIFSYFQIKLVGRRKISKSSVLIEWITYYRSPCFSANDSSLVMTTQPKTSTTNKLQSITNTRATTTSKFTSDKTIDRSFSFGTVVTISILITVAVAIGVAAGVVVLRRAGLLCKSAAKTGRCNQVTSIFPHASYYVNRQDITSGDESPATDTHEVKSSPNLNVSPPAQNSARKSSLPRDKNPDLFKILSAGRVNEKYQNVAVERAYSRLNTLRADTYDRIRLDRRVYVMDSEYDHLDK